jgi:O-antigen/teichoic acid export membrane protein
MGNQILRLEESRHQIFFSILQMVATGFGGQLLLLISGLLVARILGVTGRGYLAGLSIWPMLLASLGNLGIPAACTYYLSQASRQTRQIFGETYRVALVQSVILAGLLAIVFFLWSKGKPVEVETAIYPTLIMIPATLAHQYALAVLQGQQRFAAFTTLCLLPAALYTFSVLLLFILGNACLLLVVITWVSTSVVAAIISTIVALRHEHLDWGGAPELRRQFIAFGLRGHMGAVSPVDSLPIDQAAVALFLSPASLGLYVVGYAFTNLPRLIARCVGVVTYPMVTARQGTPSAWRLIWWSFGGVTLLNIVCTALLFAVTPLLVPLFFGPEFSPAVPIARILLIGTTFVASRRILVEGLRGLGRPGASTLAEVSMYPWLAIGGPLLMLRHGAQGVAIALTIGYGLSLAVAIVTSLRLASKSSRPCDLRVADSVATPADSIPIVKEASLPQYD